MTYEQNVKAILETNFSGFKEEIIDIACKRICMLETKDETIDRVLEIVDEISDSTCITFGTMTYSDGKGELRNRVMALRDDTK